MLLLYDKVAGTTRQLAEYADFPSWSADGKYVYYSTFAGGFILPPEKTGMFRVRVADGRIERLAPATPLPPTGAWSGVAPDGSLLVLRDFGTSDIYALDVDLP